MLERADALDYFVEQMRLGHLECRNGEVWRLWELRRGWLATPRRAEKRAANGYLMLRAVDKSQSRAHNVMAHRAIWSYSNGPIPEGMVINHINHQRDDNRLENLEAVTSSQNLNHARDAGRWVACRGIENGRCKLTDADVAHIRERLAAGELQREIAASYGVRPNQVSRIKTGKRRAVTQ